MLILFFHCLAAAYIRTSSAVSAGNAEAVVQFSAGILLIVLVLDVGFASNAK